MGCTCTLFDCVKIPASYIAVFTRDLTDRNMNRHVLKVCANTDLEFRSVMDLNTKSDFLSSDCMSRDQMKPHQMHMCSI